MQAGVSHYRPEAEYFFREGCHINELWNDAGDEALSVARARVAPGVSTRWHRLEGIVEHYVILEGEGRVELGDLSRRVGPGDVAVIPAGLPQRIHNTGTGDLVFLALCTPRFDAGAYIDLEPPPAQPSAKA